MAGHATRRTAKSALEVFIGSHPDFFPIKRDDHLSDERKHGKQKESRDKQ
jgi:hypothetical protein